MISRREHNRLQQRERILAAARELFSTRGFDSVTVAEVAELAGVARATVFNTFESKHALVEAITEEVFAYFRGMLEAVLADEVTPTPALVRALFAHMGEGIEATYDFYRGVYRELVKIQLGLDEGGAAEAMRTAALERLEQLMARGQARGELRRDASAADLAHAFDSLATGTIVHWLYSDASGSLCQRMQSAADIFLGPVAAEGARHGPVPRLAPLDFDPSERLGRPGPDRARGAGGGGST